MGTISVILTADWHLREDSPICRIDDFEANQWAKVNYIKKLQKRYDCPVLHAGDLFDHWKPSPSLLSKTINFLPNKFYTVYGNHDLPQHNFELRDKSGIYTLEKAGVLNRIPPLGIQFLSWNMIPFENEDDNILLWHTMTYKNVLPYPGCTSLTARRLLKKYSQFDLIVTGDNHETFIEEYKGRILVNPGSLTRQKALQMEHKPCVFLWDASNNMIEQIYIPIEKNVISREHLEIEKKKDSRIENFVSSLDNDYITTLSFEENLKEFENINNIRNSVMNIIYKAIEL
jgi:DNA repair exonuclease SbcCD nuclease subunit